MPEDEPEENTNEDTDADALEEYQKSCLEPQGTRLVLLTVRNILDSVFGVDQSVHPPPPPGPESTPGGLAMVPMIPHP
ncbi:hypothetical protein R1flu_011072 [Riccia fluitans]|uniref:Uncharacterized protein n=1 Tax=Riccia fluitans TaxID=41844 RepID=A0ABD1Z6T0_9MARC